MLPTHPGDDEDTPAQGSAKRPRLSVYTESRGKRTAAQAWGERERNRQNPKRPAKKALADEFQAFQEHMQRARDRANADAARRYAERKRSRAGHEWARQAKKARTEPVGASFSRPPVRSLLSRLSLR